MKTATRTRIDRILKLCPPGMYQMQVSFELETILLEQDRDTRHACAEAAQTALLNSQALMLEEAASTAYAACMNAQAI